MGDFRSSLPHTYLSVMLTFVQEMSLTSAEVYYNVLHMVVVRRLNWDEWNIAHIARHGVTQADVELICHNDPLEYRQSYKDRLVVLGQAANGRVMAVIIGPAPDEPPGIYYVFTARPADRTERRYYHEQKGDVSA